MQSLSTGWSTTNKRSALGSVSQQDLVKTVANILSLICRDRTCTSKNEAKYRKDAEKVFECYGKSRLHSLEDSDSKKRNAHLGMINKPMKNTTVKINKLANEKLVKIEGVVDRRDIVHTKIYPCKICGNVFDDFRSLGGHMAAHNRPRQRGKAASSSFSATDGHNKCKSICRDENSTEVSEVYPNSQLSFEDKDGNKRDAHLGMITKAMKTTAIKNKNARPHVCHVCGDVFHNFQGLGGHVAAHNRNKATSGSVSATEGQNKGKSICGYETCTSKNEEDKDVVEVYEVEKAVKNATLKIKKLAEIGEKGEVIYQNVTVHTRTHACKKCGKVFDKCQALGGHMTAHNRTTIMKEETSASVDGVSAADQNGHNSEARYAATARDIDAAAAGGKRYTCDLCPRNFPTEQAFEGHKSNHQTAHVECQPTSICQPALRIFGIDLNVAPPDKDECQE